jgi:hypothetical protein
VVTSKFAPVVSVPRQPHCRYPAERGCSRRVMAAVQPLRRVGRCDYISANRVGSRAISSSH